MIRIAIRPHCAGCHSWTVALVGPGGIYTARKLLAAHAVAGETARLSAWLTEAGIEHETALEATMASGEEVPS